MEETLAFYETLGFDVSGCHPERMGASWAEVRRDAAVLQFYTEAPVATRSSPVLSGTLYFPVADVDALAKEFASRIRLEWGPETMDYGVREFGVQDPNGYFLAFSQPA